MLDYALRVPAFFPSPNKELVVVTACSAFALVSYYYGVQFILGRKAKTQSEKQKSWVLTALSSAVMTSLSLPFVGYWYKTGKLLAGGGRVADYGCSFFVAYLMCDLAIGTIHYRSSISILTGWIHHLAYILLISLLVIPHGFSSLFAVCCILELPTFLLAVGSLNPVFRNDYLFAAVFFITRIVIHIHIGATYGLRAHHHGETWVPTIVLCCILPMHLMWMNNCIAGILRRRRVARKLAAASSAGNAPRWPAEHIRTLPSYLLSRPLVVSALDVVRARRVALRRSRQRVLLALHDALSEVDGEAEHASGVTAVGQQQPAVSYVAAPRWRSIRRRVVGRIRRSLPEPYGVVQIAEAIDNSAE